MQKEIKRIQKIEDNIKHGRVLIIYGPRRVGKTTLLKEYLATQSGKKVFFSTGDDIKIRELFASQDKTSILNFARDYEVIAIDEAQMIKDIGLGIKMIIDEYPDKNIILTGSSSFEIAQNIGEPLTGRHFTLTLLPFAQSEIGLGSFDLKNNIQEYLVYGAYPEVLKEESHQMKEKILNELVSSYLFKDILSLDKIRQPETLIKLTKALAFQVGNEVSLNEISKLVQADLKTVQRYINILEKTFVIKKVSAFSRNLRGEISTKAKYYFYDLGVRNALLSQYNIISNRSDIGALFENFIFMELYKKDNIKDTNSNFYFWKTHTGLEVDILKEKNNIIEAFECKWSDRKSKGLKVFQEEYKNTKASIVSKDNYLDFLKI